MITQIRLMSTNVSLLIGSIIPKDLTDAVIISSGIIILSIIASIAVFNKRQI